jgi:hypothetical protein
MRTQYITDANGNKISAVLPIKEYESILEQLDELHCLQAYDKAKSRKQHFIPAAEAFKQIEKNRKKAKADV